MTDNRHKGAALPPTKAEPRLGRTPTGRKGRLSPQLRDTMDIMANEGVALPIAAERAGASVQAMKQAFRRPHVKQAYNQLIADIRANAAQGAYLRINHMSQTANSETVKLDANRWIAGVDGISPVQKVEGRHLHRHDFGGFDYGDTEARDVTPEDAASHADD